MAIRIARSTWLKIEGGERLQKDLRGLGRGVARKIGRRIVRSMMSPVLRDAKARAPVQSGLLRASIGIVARSSRGRATHTARVGTRANVSFRDRRSKQLMVSGRGQHAEHWKRKGATVTKRTANQYAGGIEFGTKADGRIARKAGGAFMLNEPMKRRTPGIIDNFERLLREEINKHAKV
jgi:hypothetical protein